MTLDFLRFSHYYCFFPLFYQDMQKEWRLKAEVKMRNFENQWYYIYHDGSYMQNGEPGGQCRRSVCAEYLYFDKDGKIKFVPLTQEGLSEKKGRLTTATYLPK